MVLIYLTLGVDASLQFIHLCTDSVSAFVFLKPPSLKPLSLICLQLACACVHHLFHLPVWRLFKKKKKAASQIHLYIESNLEYGHCEHPQGKKIPQFERTNPLAISIDCCLKSRFDLLFFCNLQRNAKLSESDGAGVHATLSLILLVLPENDHIRKSPLADTSQTQ